MGILWHKSIAVTPISGINSDRICGIRFSVDDGNASLISVIAVYLPCLDQGFDCYREHVLELERLVTESEQLGPGAVLGDFNAHLGSLGGLRGVGDTNLQGVLLQEIMGRCNLSAASLGCMDSGPVHTYYNGDTCTTVDYVLTDVEVASLMSSCCTHQMADLNTSAHLPLSVTLMYHASTQVADATQGLPKIDWDQARKSGVIDEFTNEIQRSLGGLLNNMYKDCDVSNITPQRVNALHNRRSKTASSSASGARGPRNCPSFHPLDSHLLAWLRSLVLKHPPHPHRLRPVVPENHHNCQCLHQPLDSHLLAYPHGHILEHPPHPSQHSPKQPRSQRCLSFLSVWLDS